jgi:predicted nucleic acid-binding protein
LVRTIFVDTSALLALLDRADPRHREASDAFASFADDALVTHGYVIAESLAVTRRRFGVDGVVALIDELLPPIDVLAVSPEEHRTAVAQYRASLPTGTSFVDELSFHVIRRDSIEVAFALDPDFVSSGARTLP